MKRLAIVMLLYAVFTLNLLPGSAQAAKVINSGNCGDNLTWEFADDGVLTISGEGDMYDYYDQSQGWNDLHVTSVVIEDGVTSIGENAFEFCNDIESAVIPDSVTSIGNCAFYCSSLTDVEIPASVTSIGGNSFWGCSLLERITVAEDNPNYCSDESGVLYNKEMTELIQIPWGLSGDYTIKDGVTRIDNLKFEATREISSLTIPASVEFIDELAFDRCSGLTAVIVDAANPYYSSDENGVLYNKDKTDLIYVPGGMTGELTVHANVKRIAYWAFNDVFNSLEVIRFTGDAPVSEIDGLIWWATTVYYPENNPTWTEEVMDKFEYEEEITWIAYESENVIDDMTETTVSITDDAEEIENSSNDIEEIYDAEFDNEESENVSRAIVMSVLRGVGIGVAGIAVIAGVVFAVIHVRKRIEKKDN